MVGDARVAWGVLIAAVGVLGYRWAADVADLSESFDAVGSRRGFEGAEAAGWKRALYRAGFALVVAAGAALALWGAVVLVT